MCTFFKKIFFELSELTPVRPNRSVCSDPNTTCETCADSIFAPVEECAPWINAFCVIKIKHFMLNKIKYLYNNYII